MTELPQDGPGREILLRALREYRETCEAPFLQPNCPYALEVRPGVRNCGEECVEMLIELDGPGPQDEIVIGEFGLRRLPKPPRLRKAEASEGPAFDARQIYLADQLLPYVDRRSVALLYELSEIIDDAGEDDRDARVSGCIKELDRRGFDTELLVRYGFGDAIAARLALYPVIKRIVDDLPALHDDWQTVIANDPSVHAAIAQAPRILAWLEEAPFDDILALRAPARDYFDGLELEEDYRDRAAPHRWVTTRFLKTYFQDWSTDSLRLEWKYWRGLATPLCPTAQMNSRSVDDRILASELLQRLETDKESPRRFPLERYVLLAIRLLEEGRRSEAAEIFRVVKEADPNDPHAFNNYGFCILPDDALGALAAFQRASELGWEEWPLTVANRMLAMALLGRFTPALELAERHLNALAVSPGRAWLWRVESPLSAGKLEEYRDVRQYILDLAVRIAEETGDPSIVRSWISRQECYRDASATR